MCGRFTLATDAEILQQRFHAQLEMGLYRPTYNAAPSQGLSVILNDNPGSIVKADWGFVPHWADGREGLKPLINARGESVADKPFFRDGFKRNRCLVLADGFYEWRRSKRGKVPYRIALKTKEPFAFAGLWSRVHDPAGKLHSTFAIITTVPNELVAKIHDRMPVILTREDEEDWLNPQLALDQAKAMLSPYPVERMVAYEVSALVNSPKYNQEDLVWPVNGDSAGLKISKPGSSKARAQEWGFLHYPSIGCTKAIM
jgi:putative SOS response-associated peptidase YedK